MYRIAIVSAVCFAFPAMTQAEVVTIEGTIKSVDAKKRTITVRTKTKTLELDVSRKAKVSVKGKKAQLDSLKLGQKVKISYHDELEIVLKIEADIGAGSNWSAVGEIRRFDGHTGKILTTIYSPTGKVVASGASDRTIRIWNVEDENSASHIVLQHPVPKGAGVTMLAFSPDGKTLASSASNGSIRLWDMKPAQPRLKEILSEGKGIVTALAFSPDGRWLAMGERRVHPPVRRDR